MAGDSVPNLAGSVITTSDELVSALVKCAIRQGKQMGTKHFEECELLFLVFELLFNQFYQIVRRVLNVFLLSISFLS